MGIGGRKPPCQSQLDSSSRFDTITACDGQTDGRTDGHNDSSIALSSKKHQLHLFWSPTVCCTHSFAVFICPYSLLHYTKLSIAYRLLYWDGILSNQMPVGWLVGATTQLLWRRYMMAYSRVVLTPYLFDNFTRSHSGLVVSTSNCGLRGSRFKFHCKWLCYGYAALGMASTKVNSALCLWNWVLALLG